jgi:hypothetical protein
MALQPLVRPWSLFQMLNLYTVGRIPWKGDQHVAMPLSTHRTTQTQNKSTQTSMPRAEFETTTPAFERAKTVHALDRAATVIGLRCCIHSSMALQPFVGSRPFFSFVILYTIGRTPWTGDQPVASPLITHRAAETE